MTEPLAHVMIDIETLGKKPGCIILSIGACTFGLPFRGDQYSHTFHEVIDFTEETELFAEPSTIAWWFAQTNEARAALATPERRPLTFAIGELVDWLDEARCREGHDGKLPLRLWCNGASFDFPILEAAIRSLGHDEMPWHYRELRDLRTLLEVAGIDIKYYPPLVPHNALEDAVAQGKAAEAALLKLGQLS